MARVKHLKGQLAKILRDLDLGSSVAETDNLLEAARVETSVFSDLLADRVDLVPGTKGPGKSALYRICVDFLPNHLIKQRRVVIAHGVQSHGDSVFHAFKDQFDRLSEADFIDFWCIYLVSLSHEHFIKNTKYARFLSDCKKEIDDFKRACQGARIPEIQAKKSLKEVLAWALEAVSHRIRPKVTYKPEDQELGFELLSPSETSSEDERPDDKERLPQYVTKVRDTLESILCKADLHLWLMVDRLDEVFPRRSKTETKALRALLKTMQIFSSSRIRLKIFLRADIFGQIATSADGFTGLTHITVRQADGLRWAEDQILTLVVIRLNASAALQENLNINSDRLAKSR